LAQKTRVKEKIQHLLHQAILGLQAGGVLPDDIDTPIIVDRARQKEHGDLASNIALALASKTDMKPRVLAEAIVKALPASDDVLRTEIAGPGFINFFLRADAVYSVVPRILDAGTGYGHSEAGKGQTVQVEFVSANPTGPLHVGHGRGAAYGATVANLLEAAGYDVHREYYVNDAGRQMDILAVSVWLRYLDLCGEEVVFPSNGYRGDYVWDIAATIHREHGASLRRGMLEVLEDIPADEPAGGDKEVHIDALVSRMRKLLGEDAYRIVHRTGLDAILDDIRRDLEDFGVVYDQWFSEHSLVETGAVQRAIDRLRKSGHAYEKKGALWFRSTDYGDEKDRVIVRENGQHTYFAADIAYHMDKLDRGFGRMLDIWGADHHGYVPRVKAALAAMDEDPARLDVLLVQFAVLYRGGAKVQMSTRSGEFVTLRELRHEVGNDAARFFYVMRKSEQHLDFDLDLAKSQSNDNPVYYIQYAHARIHSVFRQLREKGMSYDPADGNASLARLTEDHEIELLNMLQQYPELLEQSALRHEPHQLVHFLRELANRFHTYYNAHTFLADDESLRNARLNLISATRQVIANALALLGVSAPETM
jgi:arginyl-tRNA synthetase